MTENKRISVIGCGRQAQALVFDFCRFGRDTFDEMVLIDQEAACINRLKRFVTQCLKKIGAPAPRWINRALDASRLKPLQQAVKGSRMVISASHYALNPIVAQAAINNGAHFADLGGYLDSTLKIQRLDAKARQRGVRLVPDLGVAPGLANILAGWALSHMELGVNIRIYCGGLPEKPVGPLGYKIVFSVAGLWGTHFGKTVILRDGAPAEIENLTELEEIDFPDLGRLEAYATGGALAAAPWTLQKKVNNYEYKTLRYPGYVSKMKFLQELGLTEARPRRIKNVSVAPRDLLGALFQEKLAFPQVPDVLALRVVLEGKFKDSGELGKVVFETLDRADSLGFSAMERSTGFSAALACQMILSDHGLKQQAKPSGFCVLEELFDADVFIKELKKRGIEFKKGAGRHGLPAAAQEEELCRLSRQTANAVASKKMC